MQPGSRRSQGVLGGCRRDQFTLDLMEKVPQGAGSGTIWDADGHVVTNAHVIAGASDLQARLAYHQPSELIQGQAS